MKQILLFTVFSFLIVSYQNCADGFVPPESLSELGSVEENEDDGENNEVEVPRTLDIQFDGLSSVKAGENIRVSVVPSASDNILNDLNLTVEKLCPNEEPVQIHSDNALLGQVLVDLNCEELGTSQLKATLESQDTSLKKVATKMIAITQPDSQQVSVALSVKGSNTNTGIDVDEMFVVTANLGNINLTEGNINFEAGSTYCNRVIDSNLNSRQAKFQCTQAIKDMQIIASIVNNPLYHGSGETKIDVEKIEADIEWEGDDFKQLYVNMDNKIFWETDMNLGPNEMILSENNGKCVASFDSNTKINLKCTSVTSGTLSLKVSDANRKYKGSISKAFSIRKKTYGIGFSPASSDINLLVDGSGYRSVTKEISISVSNRSGENVSLSVTENSSHCSISNGSAWNKKKLTCSEPTEVKLSITASSSVGGGTGTKTYKVKKPYRWRYDQNVTGAELCANKGYPNTVCSASEEGDTCSVRIYQYTTIPTRCTDDY